MEKGTAGVEWDCRVSEYDINFWTVDDLDITAAAEQEVFFDLNVEVIDCGDSKEIITPVYLIRLIHVSIINRRRALTKA